MKKTLFVAAGVIAACLGTAAYSQSAACIGCATIPNPISPDCTSGLAWQPQPTGVYTCKAPGPPFGGGGKDPGNGGGTPMEPIAVCTTAIQAQGFYNLNHFGEIRSNQPPKREFSGMANGPWTDSGDECQDPTHLYVVYCMTNSDNTLSSVAAAPQPENVACGGGGG